MHQILGSFGYRVFSFFYFINSSKALLNPYYSLAAGGSSERWDGREKMEDKGTNCVEGFLLIE